MGACKNFSSGILVSSGYCRTVSGGSSVGVSRCRYDSLQDERSRGRPLSFSQEYLNGSSCEPTYRERSA